MAVSRGNGQNGGHFYSNITQPVKVYANFVVDAANGNGLGIRSLKSNGYIHNVFMHTTAAFTGTSHTSTLIDGISGGTSSLVVGMPVQGSGIPAGTTIASIVSSSSITLSAATTTSTTGSITYQGLGNGKQVNMNPQSGTIFVQFRNNYKYYLGGASGFVSPLSGSTVTSTTLGLVYVIVSLGTTTLAQWQAAGVIPGQVPAVGLSFIAKATGAIGGTGAVQVPATAGSGITSIEAEGDASLSWNSSIAANAGTTLILNCYASGTLTAPAANSVLGLSFDFDSSSVTIDGL